MSDLLARGKGGFRIVIDSIEEFGAFCALVRGKTIDEVKVAALVNRLRKSAETLQEAEERVRQGDTSLKKGD